MRHSSSIRRRDLLQLTLGAAAASLLSACAAGSTAGPATAQPAPQPTTQAAPAASGQKVSIEYWQYFYQSKQDLVNSLILDFQKQNPNIDRKSTRLNSSHDQISYAVFCLKKKNT